MNPVDSYTGLVDEAVLRVLNAEHVRDFAALARAVGSVYPGELLSAISRLAADGQIHSEQAARLRASAGEPCRENEQSAHAVRLPPPHPLDYDWRFADVTVDQLIERADTSRGSTIALGTPSVFRRAVELSAAERMMLVDADASLVTAFPHHRHRIVHRNLLVDDAPPSSAEVIVADPPWYPAHTRAFLWAARRMVSDTGEILLSVPPLPTRPGIAREHRDLLEWLPKVGLRRISADEGALLYRTPPFERAALRAQGIFCPAGSWRRGDLWVLVPDGEISDPRPLEPGEIEWAEVQWDGVRIRFRHAPGLSSGFGADPRPLPLVTGDVLSSVSRRHPLRPQVDIWTSGNRVFRCESPALLAEVIAAVARGENPLFNAETALGRRPTQEETSRIVQSVEQMRDIVHLEREEYANTYDM